MLIGSRARISRLTSDPKIFIGEHWLQQVTVSKFPGYLIDENLSWGEHAC